LEDGDFTPGGVGEVHSRVLQVTLSLKRNRTLRRHSVTFYPSTALFVSGF